MFLCGDGPFGVTKDLKKAKHYLEQAAISGDVDSRYSLGRLEIEQGGSEVRALKHWMIAARAGHDGSMDLVRKGFFISRVTKEEYETTLRSWKDAADEMKSKEREHAIEIIPSRNQLLEAFNSRPGRFNTV